MWEVYPYFVANYRWMFKSLSIYYCLKFALFEKIHLTRDNPYNLKSTLKFRHKNSMNDL